MGSDEGRANPIAARRWCVVRDEDGVATVSELGDCGDERDVALVYSGGSGTEAGNARLVAAAPELRELAELVMGTLASMFRADGETPAGVLIERARSLLSRLDDGREPAGAGRPASDPPEMRSARCGHCRASLWPGDGFCPECGRLVRP